MDTRTKNSGSRGVCPAQRKDAPASAVFLAASDGTAAPPQSVRTLNLESNLLAFYLVLLYDGTQKI